MLVLSIRKIVIVRTKDSICIYVDKSLYQKLRCYATKTLHCYSYRDTSDFMKYYILSPFTLENANSICHFDKYFVVNSSLLFTDLYPFVRIKLKRGEDFNYVAMSLILLSVFHSLILLSLRIDLAFVLCI